MIVPLLVGLILYWFGLGANERAPILESAAFKMICLNFWEERAIAVHKFDVASLSKSVLVVGTPPEYDNQIACLQSGQAALPAVLHGATSITVDESGMWQLMLAREMKRAGLDVDLNRAL